MLSLLSINFSFIFEFINRIKETKLHIHIKKKKQFYILTH